MSSFVKRTHPRHTTVVVADPEMIKEVMHDMKRFAKMPGSEIWTSKLVVDMAENNIVVLNGDAWWRVKKTFASAFHMTNVRTLVPVFHERTLRMFALLRQRTERDGKCRAADVNFAEWASRMTMDFLSNTLFSHDVGALPDDVNSTTEGHGLDCPACASRTIKSSEFVDAFACLFAVAGDMKATFIPYYDKIPFMPHHRCLPKAVAALNNTINHMIAKHKAEMQREEVKAELVSRDMGTEASGGAVPGRFRTNLLHMMLSAIKDQGSDLTDDELRINLVTFFIAGHETTATALTWAAHYLAMDQDRQQRLRDELHEKLGPLRRDADGKFVVPTPEQLGPTELPYLNAVMKEIVRLKPAIANIQSRVATCNTTLGKYSIRKGMFVAANVYAVHHDAKLWPDPEEFRPERFLARERRHPCAFVPFSVGPRQCIGNNFSTIEQRVFLAHLVRAWRLEPPACGSTHGSVKPHFYAIGPDRSTSTRIYACSDCLLTLVSSPFAFALVSLCATNSDNPHGTPDRRRNDASHRKHARCKLR